jgi:uncharacterized protein (DUF885 family)
MSDAAAAFDALAEEFFSVWFRYHPDLAILAGVRGFERLLPAQGDDELAALGAWLETLIVALEELDYSALDEERRIDLRLMFGAARIEHKELLERDWRHRDPLHFLPVRAIHRLTLQPPEDVRGTVAHLFAAVPEYLRLALAHLRSMAELIPLELVNAAVDESERGRCYLRELAQSPWLKRNCYGFSEIEDLIEDACRALAGFSEVLAGEVGARAAGRLACGEAHLRFLFRHRHFIELEPTRARAVLGVGLEEANEALEKACRETRVNPAAAWHYVAQRRVGRGERLAACRRESAQLSAFMRQTGLVTLPKAPLRVTEWSACPRLQGLGADYLADRQRKCGAVLLDGLAADEEVGESLPVLRARCMDLTWGGSHLLAFAGGERGWRLPRALSANSAFAVAWRLYLRERLGELGHLDPDDRLLAILQRQAALHRALLDLDLHLGRVSGAEARDRLTVDPQAGGDALVSLARRPGEALAGALGWQALSRARQAASGRQGVGFREKSFHDRLLACGQIPVSLVLETELGEAFSRESDDLAAAGS